MDQAELNRRTFLTTLGRCAGGACLACSFGPFSNTAYAAQPRKKRKKTRPTRRVDYFEPLSNGAIECKVCPHGCMLDDGEVGICRGRMNQGGTHYALGHSIPCIVQVDPIEKLPILHFRPGSKMLTVSSGGCNLRCMYCQNWQQAQADPREVKEFNVSPREAVAAAVKKDIKTVAFTYTEPIAFLEYAKDIAVEAKEKGMKVAVGTSLYVNPEPLRSLAKYVDAFAITLKGFSEKFYEDVCEAELAPVLRNIEWLHRNTGCWLELINLIVPTYNDNLDEIRKLSRWVHDTVGDEVPLHFARFVPKYKLRDLPRTSVQVLEGACEVASKVGLRYVYTSNIAPHEGNNTRCPRCGTVLIERLNIKILGNQLNHGRCPKCRNKIPGVWK